MSNRVTRIREAAGLIGATIAGLAVRLGDVLAVTGREILTAVERLGSSPISEGERIARTLERQAEARGFWGLDETRTLAEWSPDRIMDFPAEARRSIAAMQAELNKRLWARLQPDRSALFVIDLDDPEAWTDGPFVIRPAARDRGELDRLPNSGKRAASDHRRR